MTPYLRHLVKCALAATGTFFGMATITWIFTSVCIWGVKIEVSHINAPAAAFVVLATIFGFFGALGATLATIGLPVFVFLVMKENYRVR